MSESLLPRGKLVIMIAVRLLSAVLMLSLLFFLPAGTFAYWQAWVYMAALLVPMFINGIYLLKNDPKALERRMRMKEKRSEQQWIIGISLLYFLLIFMLPGFDRRFGWSHVPAAAVIVADVLVVLSCGLLFLVMRENRYASRIIEVEQGQKVISSGPYAVVRHPMYLAVSLMLFVSPLALGSYWAMIPSLLIVPLLMARIQNEERLLEKDLAGYQEYQQKTRYRLIPGIW